MTQPIVYVDTSAIREGKLDELKASMTRLASFIEANVPQLLSYGFFLDESRARMTVVALHPDSTSLEFHLAAGGAEFRKFADLIELIRIDVFGRVSDAAVERLHQKAQMLGNATVAVHEWFAGFARYPSL